MPQELKQVNGRWVVTGAQRSSDLAPVAPPPGQRVMPMPARVAAPRPRPQGQAKPWWAKLGNDLLYEWRQSPIGAAWNQINVGMAGASDNGLRMGYSAVQRMQGRKKADPSSGRFGAELDRFVDQTYRKLGAKPPSQMSQAERDVDQMRRSVALNLVLAPVSPGFGAARAATAVGIGLRGGAAFAVNEALSTFLDDNTGGNVVNLINSLRLDPTDFQGVPFVRGLRKGEKGLGLPGAVNVGRDDMVDAAAKSLLPNAAASLAVGVGAGAAVAGVAGFRNIRRNIRAHRAVEREVQQRAKQEAMGVLQKDEADGYDFAPEVKQPTQPAAAPGPTFQEANAAMEQRLGAPAPAAPETGPAPAIDNATVDGFGKAQPGELPQADPAIDYWTYDPELPESTALGKTLEELSDQELVTLQQGAGLPVVERVNQTVEARAGIEPRPPMAAQMVMAPADRLADDYLESVTRKLGAREDYELRPLFDPEANQQLWQKAQALTGVDDPSQLSKADMLDTFNAMRADGQAPIVNRMMGGQMLPTAEVQAAPQVFQYKGGVNEAGEQIGNSLEGVERWDPNAENIIQVWRDANGEIGQPGAVYVVNGHNRLAAAKRMGIPSMRVEYLDSPTAGEARLQGAISNVSDGKGTVFDAAKLAREYGITDQAQLKAMGKPGASGFWKEGLALSRLPEDVFLGAVNAPDQLKLYRLIGESGASPEIMRSAHIYITKNPKADSAELVEMIDYAKANQRAEAAASSQSQGEIRFDDWDSSFDERMLAMNKLAVQVNTDLAKDKRLFRGTARNANRLEAVGTVDAKASKAIGDEAARAQQAFKDLKYVTGPVNSLMNEGVERVMRGESVEAAAKGIRNRLAAAIGEAMGKEVAPAADVVQEDMFAAAARAVDEPQAPIELTPDERAMAEAQLLQEAIANGEVRPPNAPIPELPEPAQVRLEEVAAELTAAPPGPLLRPGIELYHGTTEASRKGIMASGFRVSEGEKAGTVLGDGVYFAGNPGYAAAYGDKTAWGELPADARVLDLKAQGKTVGDLAKQVGVTGELKAHPSGYPDVMLTYEQQQQIKSWALANGYDGIRFRSFDTPGDPELETVIYNVSLANRLVGSKAATAASASAQPGKKLAQATADEVRLAIEHKQADAAMAWEQQQAARDAVAYEELTFDQKKDAGLGGGIDDVGLDEMRYLREELAAGSYPPEILQDMARKLAALEKRYGQAITPEVLPPEMPRLSDQLRQNLNNLGQSIGEFSKTVDDVMQRQDASLAQRAEDLAARAEEVPISELPKISDVLQSTMRAMAESDARLYRGLGESLGSVKRGLGELADAPVRPEPLRLTASAEQPEFILPQELSKSAPRYGRYTVKFDSDLDRAAYVLANDAVKPSKAASKFRAAIEAAGMDSAEVVAHGKRVKAALKKAAQGNLTGQVELPAQPFGDVAKPPTKAGADRVRQQIEVNNQTMDDIRRKAQQEGC
jgi:Poly(ADP-ribose) polymerase catalytic domain